MPSGARAGVEDVEVRPVMAAEADALLALIARIDAEAPFALRGPGERPVWARSDRPASNLAAFLARPNTTLLVAAADGRLVGHLSAAGGGCLSDRGAVTLAIGIDKDWRRRGLGRRLLARVESWAWRAGCHRLGLTVAHANHPARALYHQAGFVEEGRLRRAQRLDGAFHDELVLAKLANPPAYAAWPPLVLDAPPPSGLDGLEIRPARLADADAFATFDRIVHTQTPFLARSDSETLADAAAGRGYLAARLADPDTFIALALLPPGPAPAGPAPAGAPALVVGAATVRCGGTAGTRHDGALTLAVRREYWRHGIGGRLFAAALVWCRASGRARLSAWAFSHNPAARRFLAGHGCREEAVCRRFAVIAGRYADIHLVARLLTDGATYDDGE